MFVFTAVGHQSEQQYPRAHHVKVHFGIIYDCGAVGRVADFEGMPRIGEIGKYRHKIFKLAMRQVTCGLVGFGEMRIDALEIEVRQFQCA
ncbi:hypothetical protein SDC9_205860 [bioreactor metagenome]|uniref:Uncharacterized protein n=1 Tax=bioreactor metagenome TaxID=1076179 RepID=A0A645J630_9ZZZZ